MVSTKELMEYSTIASSQTQAFEQARSQAEQQRLNFSRQQLMGTSFFG